VTVLTGPAREGQRGVRIACECACLELATLESSERSRHPLIPPIPEVGFDFLDVRKLIYFKILFLISRSLS